MFKASKGKQVTPTTLSQPSNVAAVTVHYQENDSDISYHSEGKEGKHDATKPGRFIDQSPSRTTSEPGTASMTITGSNFYYQKAEEKSSTKDPSAKPPVTILVTDAAALSYTLSSDGYGDDVIGACSDGYDPLINRNKTQNNAEVAKFLTECAVAKLAEQPNAEALSSSIEALVADIHTETASKQTPNTRASGTLVTYRCFAPQETQESYTFVGFGVGDSMLVGWNPWLKKFYNLVPAVMPKRSYRETFPDTLGDSGDGGCYLANRIFKQQQELPPGTFIISLTDGAYSGLAQTATLADGNTTHITLNEQAMKSLLSQIPLQEFVNPQNGATKIAQTMVHASNATVKQKIEAGRQRIQTNLQELQQLQQHQQQLTEQLKAQGPAAQKHQLIGSLCSIYDPLIHNYYDPLNQQLSREKGPYSPYKDYTGVLSVIRSYKAFLKELELIVAYARSFTRGDIVSAALKILQSLPRPQEEENAQAFINELTLPNLSAIEQLNTLIKQAFSGHSNPGSETPKIPAEREQCQQTILALSQELTQVEQQIAKTSKALEFNEGGDATVQVSYLPDYSMYFLQQVLAGNDVTQAQARIVTIPIQNWLCAYSNLAGLTTSEPTPDSDVKADAAGNSLVYSQNQLRTAMAKVFKLYYADPDKKFDKKGDAFYFLTQVVLNPDQQKNISPVQEKRMASIPLKEWFDAFRKIADMQAPTQQALYSKDDLEAARAHLYKTIHKAQETRLAKYRNWGIVFIFLGFIPGLIIFAIRSSIKSHQEIATLTVDKGAYLPKPQDLKMTQTYESLFNKQGELRKMQEGQAKPLSNSTNGLAAEKKADDRDASVPQSASTERTPLLKDDASSQTLTFFGTRKQIERLQHKIAMKEAQEENSGAEAQAEDPFIVHSKEESTAMYGRR